MDYMTSIIVILVGIILGVLVMRLLSGLLKTAATLLLILVVGTGAIGAALYTDYATIQTGMEENAILVVEHNEEHIVSINVTQGQETELLEQEPTNTSITLRVDSSTFENASYSIPRVGLDLSFSDVEHILEAETLDEALEPFTEEQRTGLEVQYETLQELQRDIMLLGVQDVLAQQQQRFIIDGVRSGNIEVEPPLLTFRLLSIIPEPLLDSTQEVTNESIG